jgi:hypothetical protein
MSANRRCPATSRLPGFDSGALAFRWIGLRKPTSQWCVYQTQKLPDSATSINLKIEDNGLVAFKV